MNEVSETGGEQRSFSGVFLGLLVLAVLAAAGGLIWSYLLNNRLARAEAQLLEAQQERDKIASDLRETNAKLKITSDSVGLTQKQLEARAQELMRRQESDAKRLESEQAATKQQIGAVSSDVSSVKTDVGGVKTDVAQTKTELQSAEAQLQSMKGDLGIQSGLIAKNHDELEVLKHKGDRNYYEFTLHKGQRQAVSTVGLELRKADTKHNRYTLNVYADDKKIEKKDRGLNEPVQFYTGKDNYLYELVVNNISKNEIQGYISTPKNAPVPVNPGH
ncbi:MAG TPA: hypothetical protein VFA02_14740 [Pseudacidobacterium sp.]|nr:hypothetical protein [Pseudacidobacterium sp.]